MKPTPVNDIEERQLPTPHGPGRLVQRRSSRPWASLVLTHGAGAGIDTHDLQRLAISLPGFGVTTSLLEMPWVGAGRRVAPGAAVLDECFVAMVNTLKQQTPTFMAGRSAGARVACRQGRRLGAVGVVALSFPLHAKGNPDKSRVDELMNTRLPRLVVQGERDAMGTPYEFPPQQQLVSVPYANHSLVVPKRATVSQDHTSRFVASHVLEWIAARVRHELPGTTKESGLLI